MIANLAYVIFRSPSVEEWRSFGADVVGAVCHDDADGAVRLQIDERPWRIEIQPGETDELVAIGWDVSAQELEATVDAVERLGITVERTIDGTAELAHQRHADDVATFIDPFGFRYELAVGIEDQPYRPSSLLEGTFVTGAQGMGHIVLMVPDLADATQFLTDALGLALSDTIQLSNADGSKGQTLRFFHCAGAAARHHAIALSEVPGRRGVHHVMLEYSDPDDVGRAFDRVRDAGMPLAMDYGRHPNDLVTSFYVRTPSGFELELGSGGVTVDDQTWTTAEYDAMSLWGHRPPADGPLRPGILVRVGAPASSTSNS